MKTAAYSAAFISLNMINMISALRAAVVAFVILAAVLMSGAAVANAGDVSAGEEKAQTCVQCHGANGNEPIADYPILAGQHRKYLLYALRSYKNGKRDNAVMKSLLEEYSDKDLQDLAAYFAAQSSGLK